MWEPLQVGDDEWAVIELSPAGIPVIATDGTPDSTTFTRARADRIAAERNASEIRSA